MFIGLDFGTLSVRGIVYDTRTRTTKWTRTELYASDAIVDFEDGTCLFRDANEWVKCGYRVIAELGKNLPKDSKVQGLGVAFTSCTMVPMQENGVQTSVGCTQGPHKRPHMYPKMWRHHSPHAQKVATELTRLVSQKTLAGNYFQANTIDSYMNSKKLGLMTILEAA